ncbi:hypothetical protein EDC04DRAFT_1698850 [Pisolithus marmoratus]|nr:hypothetical protein EDC04DRAFT_1698850 [Pisolithus marmoratus]
MDCRASFVFGVIQKLLRLACDFYPCPKLRGLWLQIIEGLVDDDVWLWVDGDEEWLPLRRRIALQRYPTVTGSHGKRNERIRSATPAQRVCAIAWLIANSKGVAELFAFHGRTPPTFRTPKIASILSNIIGKYWDAFPSQASAWENALAKSKEDGCICSPVDCRGMRQWFDMVVWLEGTPPTLEVGYESCARCRSILKSWYEDIGAQRTKISHVSLLQALYFYHPSPYPCALPKLSDSSERPSPTAESLVNKKLEPLMKKHGFDAQYLPWVNRYPEGLRQHIAQQTSGCHSGWPSSMPIVVLPDNIFDAPDPWVVLGTIALVMWSDPAGKDTNLHDEDWHNLFSYQLRLSLDCFDLPVHPSLSATNVRLCHKLDQDYSEQRSFRQFGPDRDQSDWVYSRQGGRQLRLSTAVTVAVATFLRSKDVDLYGCRGCHAVCMESFTDPSTVGFEVGSSGEHEGLGPPSDPHDALRGEYSSFQVSLEVGVQEPAGMEAFTSTLRNTNLSKHEKRSQLVREVHKDST